MTPPDSSGTVARPATIFDVATAAGVSRQTVTRATNGLPGISAATRARVLDVATQLAYRPSRHARGLVSGGVRQLGLVVHDLSNPFSPEFAAAVVRLAGERGYNVMITDTALSREPQDTLDTLGEQVDVMVGYLGSHAATFRARFPRVPLIEIDPPGTPAGAAVIVDPVPAIAAVLDHLVALGVHHPVVIDPGEAGGLSPRGRLLRAAWERVGLPPVVVHAKQSMAQTSEAAERLLKGPQPVDAIVAFNDEMAVGVLHACRRAGVSVPETVRVVGVDGLSLGAYVTPTLTTLHIDMEAVARHAFELATDVLERGASGSESDIRHVQNTLLLRESA